MLDEDVAHSCPLEHSNTHERNPWPTTLGPHLLLGRRQIAQRHDEPYRPVPNVGRFRLPR